MVIRGTVTQLHDNSWQFYDSAMTIPCGSCLERFHESFNETVVAAGFTDVHDIT